MISLSKNPEGRGNSYTPHPWIPAFGDLCVTGQAGFLAVLGKAPGFADGVQMFACTDFVYSGALIASGPLSAFGIQLGYPVSLRAFLKLYAMSLKHISTAFRSRPR